MMEKFKKVLLCALQPRIVMLFIALSNFVWYFPKSKTVKEFGSEVISFGEGPWYYEGAHAAKPLILLFATLFVLSNHWRSYLITAVISGYLTIEGIIWISRGKGFIGGLADRIELISTYPDSKVWQFLDWQYLLALIIFIIASGYLINCILKIKQKSSIPINKLDYFKNVSF